LSERPLYIVDASVVSRWYLLNPPYVEDSLKIRRDYDNDRISLVAPANLRYEVEGAIRHSISSRFGCGTRWGAVFRWPSGLRITLRFHRQIREMPGFVLTTFS